MPNFPAKDESVLNRQLKVQRLVMPFTVTHNATPASVVIGRDDNALLFLKTQGVDQITAVADGSPSFVSAVDSTGTFDILVKINESVAKVMHAEVFGRTASLVVGCTLANTTGLTAAGDKIVLNCASGVNFSTTDLDAVLVVEYVTAW